MSGRDRFQAGSPKWVPENPLPWQALWSGGLITRWGRLAGRISWCCSQPWAMEGGSQVQAGPWGVRSVICTWDGQGLSEGTWGQGTARAGLEAGDHPLPSCSRGPPPADWLPLPSDAEAVAPLSPGSWLWGWVGSSLDPFQAGA